MSAGWFGFLVFLVVVGSIAYFLIAPDVHMTAVCSHSGADYHSDSKVVDHVSYVKCCSRALPDDVCSWVIE
jgi:hypothetical protein